MSATSTRAAEIYSKHLHLIRKSEICPSTLLMELVHVHLAQSEATWVGYSRSAVAQGAATAIWCIWCIHSLEAIVFPLFEINSNFCLRSQIAIWWIEPNREICLSCCMKSFNKTVYDCKGTQIWLTTGNTIMANSAHAQLIYAQKLFKVTQKLKIHWIHKESGSMISMTPLLLLQKRI